MLSFLLDNIFVRFVNSVFRQICSKLQWELIQISFLICFFTAINLIFMAEKYIYLYIFSALTGELFAEF